MTATYQAILQAPLRCWNLQRLKLSALCKSQSYETMVNLNWDTKRELDQWITSMTSLNGRNILSPEQVLTMESDASQLGWEPVCNGVHTGGLWLLMERLVHINCLELTGAIFAVKAFSRDKGSFHIQPKLDNTTVVAYVNHMGDSLSSI